MPGSIEGHSLTSQAIQAVQPELEMLNLGSLRPGWSVVLVHEARIAALDTHQRKARGAWFTPLVLASRLARFALPPAAAPSGPVLDPCCGSGALLLAVCERLSSQLRPMPPPDHILSMVRGVERDPASAAAARRALWVWCVQRLGQPPSREALERAVVCADAFTLLHDHPTQYGAVVLNPPFRSAIHDGAAARAERVRVQAQLCTVRGAWDWATAFTELSLSLLAPGGRLAALVPNKVLAAESARALRQWAQAEFSLEYVGDFTRPAEFAEAAIYPVILGVSRPLHRGLAPTPVRVESFEEVQGRNRRRHHATASAPIAGQSWGTLLSPGASAILSLAPRCPPLASRVSVFAGATVAEAYACKPCVVERGSGGPGWRLLTTALVGALTHRHGTTPARYLGETYAAPELLRSAPLGTRRRAVYDNPKVVVAGLSQMVRASLVSGDCAAAVGTAVVVAKRPTPRAAAELTEPETLAFVAGVLCSRGWSRVYRTHYGALALQGGILRVGPRELSALPFPWEEPAWWQREVARWALAAQEPSVGPKAALANIDALIEERFRLCDSTNS
jgi:tRNA1(Val) A37 N6-methylase TrmN6